MNKYFYQKNTPFGVQKARIITHSTELILDEAESLGIKWEAIVGTEVIKLSYQDKIQYFNHQVSPLNSSLSSYLCNNKNEINNLFSCNSINVSKNYFLSKDDSKKYWKEVFESLKKPLVVKPSAGAKGGSVFVGINDLESYNQAVAEAMNYSLKPQEGVLVEEMFESEKEYRILTTRERVIGVINRVPANVIGNGNLTIKELIDEKNLDERRGDGGALPLSNIKIDELVKDYLAEQGFNLNSVLDANKQVFLRKTSNLSTGGDSIDVTDIAHQSVKKIALKVINSVPGLEFAGVDFMTKDITKLQDKNSYIIIEVNASPGIDMHDTPYQGKNRHVAREFLFLIFPELRQNR